MPFFGYPTLGGRPLHRLNECDTEGVGWSFFLKKETKMRSGKF
jgi:hypothetical protein